MIRDTSTKSRNRNHPGRNHRRRFLLVLASTPVLVLLVALAWRGVWPFETTSTVAAAWLSVGLVLLWAGELTYNGIRSRQQRKNEAEI